MKMLTQGTTSDPMKVTGISEQVAVGALAVADF